MRPEEIKQNCIIDDLKGCWIFKGAGTKDGGAPRVWMFDPHKGHKRIVSGPRAAAIAGGKILKRGWRAWMTCDCKQCLNPDHVMTGTTKKYGLWVASTNKLKNNPKVIASSKKRMREKYPEREKLAREARNFEGTGREFAKMTGLDERTVSKMKNSKRWADVNPFAGLA